MSIVRNKKRSEIQLLLAQFFTPQIIADYMSNMFDVSVVYSSVSILDPGAGEGILGTTLQKRVKEYSDIVFVEMDKATSKKLYNNVNPSAEPRIEVLNDDFAEVATKLIDEKRTFSHVILNPPYFKLNVNSKTSNLLRQYGIKVTNIYAAFMWLSARLLTDKGQMVAIVPRSFCNGPYFENFRQFISKGYSIDHIHLFESRNKAFAEDQVLQENIIIKISKSKQAQKVKITYSSDKSFTDIKEKTVSVSEVYVAGDESYTIHIPQEDDGVELSKFVSHKLVELGLTASTGPIVDFRSKDNIETTITNTNYPLLYPAHMDGHLVRWPVPDFKKIGQYFQPSLSPQTSLVKSQPKGVLPLDGYYVIIRRFSSKEEKRRIFAAVVDPVQFKQDAIAFENHLNYIHASKHGFGKYIAYGLCAYLNSSIVDRHFRKFSGHTQVNVTDLKSIPFPNLSTLERLGRALESVDGLMDDIVVKEITGTVGTI